MSILKTNNHIETIIKTALVFLIIYICFLIFKPFLLPIIWAIIIAVSIYPLHLRLNKLLKGKSKLSASIITILLLSAIIIPAFMFLGSLITYLKELAIQFKNGTLQISPPPEDVNSWPIVGNTIYDIWQLFFENLTKAVTEYKDQIKMVGEKFIAFVSGFAGGLVSLIIAIIISGVFLVFSDQANVLVLKVFKQLIGDKGVDVANNSKATIKSVVNGVLGTAIIQSTIIAVGFFVADVPGAPILSLLVLILAIIQLPPVLIVVPVVIYMFSTMTTTGAILFTVWNVIGALSDNILKPMLLGKGMEIPMLIILIGSIGGMLLMGIVGLFIGAVILALGYQLFNLWIEDIHH